MYVGPTNLISLPFV